MNRNLELIISMAFSTSNFTDSDICHVSFCERSIDHLPSCVFVAYSEENLTVLLYTLINDTQEGIGCRAY